MSKKTISAKDKISAVMLYFEGNVSQHQLAERLEVSLATVQQWIRNYESMGEDAFQMKHYKRYSKELKLQAVQEYLAGYGSQDDICKKYGIRSKSKLQKWIKQYNGYEVFKSYGTGGSQIMTKGRKTKFEERVEIVQYCIAHDRNYVETAKQYQVSYQQARSYTVKYDAGGVEVLRDNRGKRKNHDEMSELEKLRAEVKILRAEKQCAEMEASFKKTRRDREEAGLSLIRHEHIYQAIKEEHEAHNYPITELCKLGRVSRAAYYKWLNREIPENEKEHQRIAEVIESIHNESPDKGYRRIRDDLERYHDIDVNDKRVLRICRKKDIKSTIKYSNNGCTRQAANPQYIAENILNREFTADMPNEKWLTDVTEFKYYVGPVVHKIYLSAILDLYEKSECTSTLP